MNATRDTATNDNALIPMCDVCEDRPAVVADMCADCRRNFIADVSRAHATDPTSPDRRTYVSPNELAYAIANIARNDPADSYALNGARVVLSSDAWGSGMIVTTATGQTFRVIVTEIG